MTQENSPKRMVRTYRTRAYLSRKGHMRLDEVMQQQALLYNAALEERKTAWKYRQAVTYQMQSKALTAVRADFPEIEGALDRRVQVGTLRRLDKSMQAFFRRVKAGETPGYPRFKSSRRWRTIEMYSGASRYVHPSHGKYDGRIKVKGLPRISYKDARIPRDRQPLELRISRRPNGVYLYLAFDVGEAPPRVERPCSPVGIDVGVAQRFTLSDGRHYERLETSPWVQRRLQRAVSRRKKGSKRRAKAMRQLARHQNRQTVAKRNELHRITTDIVRRHDMLAIEDLDIQRLTRSKRGTVEEPGEGVAAQRRLNREILAQSWGEFYEMLSYKAEEAGAHLVKVHPMYTTLTCSSCGLVRETRPGREYICACGQRVARQTNSANNILARAQLAASGSGEVVIEGRAEMSDSTAGLPAVRPENRAVPP